MSARVSVGIVLHDSAGDIVECLAALTAQTWAPDAVVVLDNASSDDGLERARLAMPDARFERLPVNTGFAAAQIDPIWNPRRIYLGGGNAKHLKIDLPSHVHVTDNVAGLLGGIRLWEAR